jgi:hypothetical protein
LGEKARWLQTALQDPDLEALRPELQQTDSAEDGTST